MQSTADAQAAEKSKKKGAGGGLDSVLSTIKGPKAVSTVLKSSMDWDVYKEKEGLEEDLQAAVKDGYGVRIFECVLYCYFIQVATTSTARTIAYTFYANDLLLSVFADI